MNNKLNRFWNFKPLGIFMASTIIAKVTIITIFESINSVFWGLNLGRSGKNIKIQNGAKIRFPKKIFLGDNVSIGRGVDIFSEFSDSTLTIGNHSQINKNVELDFSGDLRIGENVVISEGVNVMSHNHGLDPKSKPVKCPKVIGDNVWIGAQSIILPNSNSIGKDSIIAAGSIVTKDVPENVIVAGNPAVVIRKIW